ncbi:MAG TPA: YidC/Oxa1 family membrane protein insertase [Candidatus Limnocylindria bacterium]|nr:YidC/Oxa1 family membrane protein insertase [Candidatus Limnocylindria bacterium]
MLAANLFTPLFDPLVHALSLVLTAVHSVIPNYGVALIVLALLVRVVLWPLTNMQFKSMAEMQKVQPLVKQLQAKYKNDQQQLNQKMMELYKEHKVNPLAGCVPMLIQFPILIGLYWAIQERIGDFKNEHFLWIGSPLSEHFHQFLATSLAVPDVALLALYVVSMYFTVRYGSPPSTDPQQAQTQKIMAIASPAMIAIFGFKYRWASALYIYWLAMNVFTVGQQLLMYRKHGLIGANAAAAAALPATIEQAAPKGAKAADGGAPANGGKSRYNRRSRKRAGR